MSTASKRRRPIRRGPGRALLRWHRRIGVALSAIFLVICVTGILLNHNVDLDLNNKRIEADWIYKWYGIEPQGELVHYQVGNDSLSLFSGSLYFNATPLADASELRGAATFEHFHLAATDSSLVIVSHDGEPIETLTGPSLPPGDLEGIHSADTNRAIIKTSEGFFQADSDLLAWQELANAPKLAQLAKPSPAPAELRDALASSFRGEGISWNRVILDLHSGRFFGPIGKWIVDITAFGLIFLTLTGIWYTTRYLKKARERALSK